jgi:mannose/fructose/N-acetylgalactosamine-specific phosphotransferase system component IIC
MAKIDYMKYVALGAGAVAVPKLVMGVGFLADIVAKIPDWGIQGITVAGVALASVGVGVVDHFIYK